MGILWLKISISVVIYCLAVSAVPIFNKLVFSSGVGDLTRFPYPVATAFLQLGFVAVVLACVNVAGHFCCPSAGSSSGNGDSWLLGPHFRYKIRHVAPVGLLFGLKYGVTNWGLQLVDTGMHLLLQSSDLLWTVLLARILNKERFGVIEYVAALLCAVGSIMIGARAVQTLDAPFIPILLNLVTPFFLALCISTLRMGAVELFREDNQLEGTVSPIEFTAIKLGLSSLVALVLAMCLENGTVQLQTGASEAEIRPAWWIAVGEQSFDGVLYLLLGSIFVLIFQVNITWLASLTCATTVGIVGGVKVVPQWIVNAVFNMSVDLSPLNLGGATLVLCSSILYACAVSAEKTLVLTRSGLRWQSRKEFEYQAEGSDKLPTPISEPLLMTKNSSGSRRMPGATIEASSLLDVALVTPLEVPFDRKVSHP